MTNQSVLSTEAVFRMTMRKIRLLSKRTVSEHGVLISESPAADCYFESNNFVGLIISWRVSMGHSVWLICLPGLKADARPFLASYFHTVKTLL